MIAYATISEFDKDLKQLLKRIPSIESDIETLKKFTIEVFHEQGLEVQAIKLIPKRCGNAYCSCKVVKVACKALKNKGNRTGVRIVYVFDESKHTVTFIEIYHKNDDENNDMERLDKYLKETYKV